jgi:ferredoxin
MTQAQARNILDKLASKAILVDFEVHGDIFYALPPPMAGFFEFSMMRVRSDIDQKMLSELFYQYLNVEEEFIKSLFTEGETQIGRVFVHEPALSADNALYVLDYERASEVINTATDIGVGVCYCRHKMQHLGRDCDAPKEICMTFNVTASSLIKHNFARRIDRSECLDLLQLAYDSRLVQFGENVMENVNFICNCCGCCCEAMLAAQRFAILNPVHTTNFMPEVSAKECAGCGKCISICPVGAMTLITANDPHNPRRKVANVNEETCLGCGLCVRECPGHYIKLKSRPVRILTPVNGTHLKVLMAIERGKLQNLIFDNQVLWSHRALAAVLGVILKLPPVKQIMASKQVRSVYLENLVRRFEKKYSSGKKCQDPVIERE